MIYIRKQLTGSSTLLPACVWVTLCMWYIRLIVFSLNTYQCDMLRFKIMKVKVGLSRKISVSNLFTYSLKILLFEHVQKILRL